MKIYLVNAGDSYYPSWDNTLYVTDDGDKARKFKEAFEITGKYDWVEIFSKEVK